MSFKKGRKDSERNKTIETAKKSFVHGLSEELISEKKILLAHNYYKIRGGEDESCESEKKLLTEKGHKIHFYEEHNRRIDDIGFIRTALNSIWSGETYSNVKKILSEERFDLIHVQNFFPLLSPSIYYAAKSKGVAVVQSLHNYRLLCPGALFFRNGQVCEECLNKPIPYPGIIHSCYRNSLPGSAVVCAMLTYHSMIKTWDKMVDIYIANTEFSRQKYIENGFSPHKIIVKPNFVYPDPGCGSGKGNYAIYSGRLSEEKGLKTLLKAWEKIGKNFTLKIAGSGPLEKKIKNKSNVELLGGLPVTELYPIMGEATFLIFPSEWYETFGRVAIEAFAKGTPVIASNIGAIAEVVTTERTGLLFQPGNVEDLTEKIEWMLSHDLSRMRKEARNEYETKYTAERNYELVMNIYNIALERNNK
ncbi:MAG TPA: glycosyltransferase family 4 protein [Candidatus Eremiobacteraeota bacterium]|nr:glycosyltransferase family 4 protein [Candidatus Eremiobacteraeota bacterium]